MKRASERAKELGARKAIALPVSAPFHCALMQPAEERLAPRAARAPSHAPRVPVVANVDAEPQARRAVGHRGADPAGVGARAVAGDHRAPGRGRRADRSSRWGPGTVLSGLVKKIARDADRPSSGSARPEDLDGGDGGMFDLTGQVAVVTGASRGIGRAIARGLASQGAVVWRRPAATNAAETVDGHRRAPGGRADGCHRRRHRRGVGRGAVRRRARAPWPRRRAGQQRRHRARSADAADEAGGLGRGARHQPDGGLHLCPGGAQADDRQRVRPHRQHQLGRRPDGQRRPGQLRGVEGGPHRLQQGARARGGVAATSPSTWWPRGSSTPT